MLEQKLFLKTLEHIRHGSLRINLPGGGAHQFGDRHSDLRATLTVTDSRFFSRVLLGGDDGAGDSYMDGDWSSDDLVAVIRIAVRNLPAIGSSLAWMSGLTRLAYRLRHWRRRNTQAGSRKNISEHYDLSNAFFRLFLDREMVYSSAIFADESESLEAAQMRKIDRLCEKLDLSPDDHVLEIGTGWGAFAERAARRYGCRVTTTTISREQHDIARERFAGLDRIQLLLEDYRNLKGQFDKIVSIEMFEAVGLDFYDDFFGVCDRLLRPGGSMAMQAITMNEQRFPQYHRTSDWIQRRIFPGAELASVSEILRSLGRVTSLTMVHLEDIGVHYALTLAEWRRRFHDALDDVRRLGFDERFIRMWDYYLAFCEGAFRERYIGDAQLLLTKIHTTSRVFGDPAQLEMVGPAGFEPATNGL
jgi:cyclopropane-fatty-acyl-phospholipid synthase